MNELLGKTIKRIRFGTATQSNGNEHDAVRSFEVIQLFLTDGTDYCFQTVSNQDSYTDEYRANPDDIDNWEDVVPIYNPDAL